MHIYLPVLVHRCQVLFTRFDSQQQAVVIDRWLLNGDGVEPIVSRWPTTVASYYYYYYYSFFFPHFFFLITTKIGRVVPLNKVNIM